MAGSMDLTRDEYQQAVLNAVPRRPIVHELGGGIYYKCCWLACGADIKKWFDYCPQCGQRIDWSDIE